MSDIIKITDRIKRLNQVEALNITFFVQGVTCPKCKKINDLTIYDLDTVRVILSNRAVIICPDCGHELKLILDQEEN